MRRRLVALVALAMSLVVATPATALADPGTCTCPIPWPPPRVTYAPCNTLGPIDWWYFNQGAPFVQSGIRYLIVSSTPTMDVAYGRFIANPTTQTSTGTWTVNQSRSVTITSSIGLTIAGAGRADPEELTLTVTLSTGLQVAVARSTDVGLTATSPIPPGTTMLGEYGLRSLDVVMDVQTVSMMSDGQTCAYREDQLERHTAHVPTVYEGWRFTLS